MTLNIYTTKEQGEFRAMTLAEAQALSYADHIWFKSNDGCARRLKVNGTPKRWKRTPDRIEIPVKYGLYEYATVCNSDIAVGRLLIRLS